MFKKRTLLTLLLLLVVLVLSIGCSTNTNSNTSSDSTEETYKILFASSGQTGTAMHESALEFKEAVETRTNGQVEVELAWGGVLGGDREMVDSQIRGDIDMVLTSDIGYATNIPEVGFANLPYLFPDFEAVDEYYFNGFIGERLDEVYLENGLRRLGWSENEFRALTANKPIETLDDLKGLKIRVPEFPSLLAFFKELGANPSPMAFTEVLTALQQGTMDAQDNGPTLTVSQKFYEVQDYFIFTNHVYSGAAITINEEFYSTLPEDIQQILIEEGERCGELSISLGRERIGEYVKTMEDFGVDVSELSDELQTEFKKAAMKIWDEFRGDFDPATMDKVFEVLGN